MAVYKLSKAKLFYVLYCGCSAAVRLLNEEHIVETVARVRQKTFKQDYLRTVLSVSTDGIRLNYQNSSHNSTFVPSSMIAGSTIGNYPFDDTVGIVYISPLTGEHYPAFVHVYRCENRRVAQKLLQRFRSFLLIDSHHVRLIRLENELFHRTSSGKTKNEDKVDPIRAITVELEEKFRSNQPILFPPKDYDTFHANRGHVQRAEQWKSTEPNVVGYSPILSTQKPTESTVDAVETVSLAFDFLKDEIGSVSNENDRPVKQIEATKKTNDGFIYRFRPTQATAISSNWLVRNQTSSATNKEARARSETRLLDEYQPGSQLKNRYNNQVQTRQDQFSRKQENQSQYLDTREFILRPSNQQTRINDPFNLDRHKTPTVMTNRPFSSTLDVYY